MLALVTSKWVDGDLVFYNNAGAEIARYDASAGTLDVKKLAIGGTEVTASAAELNILDGVTATATELNILDGVTKTAAQINALPVVEQAAVADIATADAAAQGDAYAKADVESIRTLSNANKAKINAILAALRAANIIAE